jgi:hypothetical protein
MEWKTIIVDDFESEILSPNQSSLCGKFDWLFKPEIQTIGDQRSIKVGNKYITLKDHFKFFFPLLNQNLSFSSDDRSLILILNFS